MKWTNRIIGGVLFSALGVLWGCSYRFQLVGDSNSDTETEKRTETPTESVTQSNNDTAGTDTVDFQCTDEDEAPTVPRSCLDILVCFPEAMDGEFEIDPDGAGGVAPLVVACDMSGGGWTLIYTEDFSSGDSSGWTGAAGVATPVDTTSSCKLAYSEMLGGYEILGGGGAFTTQTFSLHGIPHTEVSVRLDYLVIDSWDSEKALVLIDAQERYSAIFSADDAVANACGLIRPDIGPQAVAIQTEHSGVDVTVKVTSNLDQSAVDESFGVDNVVVRIR